MRVLCWESSVLWCTCYLTQRNWITLIQYSVRSWNMVTRAYIQSLTFSILCVQVNYRAHNIHLMTFGQPRVGNAAFASYFSKVVQNATRITNRHDIVPHLPPYFNFFPQKTYHHFAREVFCSIRASYYYLPLFFDLRLNSFRYWHKKSCHTLLSAQKWLNFFRWFALSDFLCI